MAGAGEQHSALGSPGEAVSVSHLGVLARPEVSAKLSAGPPFITTKEHKLSLKAPLA